MTTVGVGEEGATLAQATAETGMQQRLRAVREADEAVRVAEARCAQTNGQIEEIRTVRRARQAERKAAPDAGDVSDLRRLDRLLEDGARREEVAAAQQRRASDALEQARAAHAAAVEAVRAAGRRADWLREAVPGLDSEIARLDRERALVEHDQQQRRTLLQGLRERREAVRRELVKLTGDGV